jgi:Pyruvate phosphate dikinase, AMP/ATP-binding domain
MVREVNIQEVKGAQGVYLPFHKKAQHGEHTYYKIDLSEKEKIKNKALFAVALVIGSIFLFPVTFFAVWFQEYRNLWNKLADKEVVKLKQSDLPKTPAVKALQPANTKVESGGKTQGLEDAEAVIKKEHLTGVCVAQKYALSDSLLRPFLKEKTPAIFTDWLSLSSQFESYTGDKEAFLALQSTQTTLESIQDAIKSAFYENSSSSLADPALKKWLEDKKFLMVRSSGVEDSALLTEGQERVVNAGGNLSESYISPVVSSVLASAGRVLASYFALPSLVNQVRQSNSNPFKEMPPLNVLLNALIGEAPDSPSKDLPVSLVLFSTEPTYSQEGTSCCAISATWGHGEGVVNNEQIQTDTVFVLQSATKPGELVQVYNNQEKRERLAPRLNNFGQVALTPVKNPPEVVKQRALSQEMIARLWQLGQAAEKEMGYPVDMEIVIKNEVIHIVQMRKISRKENTPTYLSDSAIEKNFPKTPIEETSFAKVLVAGQGNVVTLNQSTQILVCNTLKEAERHFNRSKHKIVIVAQDEPANSHPTINFNTLGIPCYYSEHIQQVKKMAEQCDRGAHFVSCPQSGRLMTAEQNLDPCVVSGYFSHPAYQVLSLDHEPLSPFTAVGAHTGEIPEEVKKAFFLLKTATTAEVGLAALTTLRTSVPFSSLKERVKALEEQQNAPEEAKKMLSVIQKLESRVESTFLEIEASYTQNRPKLEILFHIKTLEILFQRETVEGVNAFSLLHVDDLEKSFTEMVGYQTQLKKPAELVDLLGVGSRGFSEADTEFWKNFLLALENDLQVTSQKKQQLRAMLTTLADTHSLPAWFNVIFLRAAKEKQGAALLDTLLTKWTTESTSLQELQKVLEKLNGAENLTAACADPKSFEKSWRHISFLMHLFKSPSILTLIQSQETTVSKVIATDLMKKYIEIVDDAIKSMKGSPHYSNKEKLDKMYIMLKNNFSVMSEWAIAANQAKKLQFTHDSLAQIQVRNLDEYLQRIEEKLENIALTEEQNLYPSSSFSVAAATLGSQAALGRHLPRTLEDIFTLIHQNELFVLGYMSNANFTAEDIRQIKGFETIEALMLSHLSTFAERKTKTGTEFTERGLKVTYNIPLLNHSAIITIDYDKNRKKTTLNIKIVGDSGEGRWMFNSKLAELLDSTGIVPLHQPTDWTSQEMQAAWDVSTADAMTKALSLLNLMLKMSHKPGRERAIYYPNVINAFLALFTKEEREQIFSEYLQTTFSSRAAPQFRDIFRLFAPTNSYAVLQGKIQDIQNNFGHSNNIHQMEKELSLLSNIDYIIGLSTLLGKSTCTLFPDFDINAILERYRLLISSLGQGDAATVKSEFQFLKRISKFSQAISRKFLPKIDTSHLVNRYLENGMDWSSFTLLNIVTNALAGNENYAILEKCISFLQSESLASRTRGTRAIDGDFMESILTPYMVNARISALSQAQKNHLRSFVSTFSTEYKSLQHHYENRIEEMQRFMERLEDEFKAGVKEVSRPFIAGGWTTFSAERAQPTIQADFNNKGLKKRLDALCGEGGHSTIALRNEAYCIQFHEPNQERRAKIKTALETYLHETKFFTPKERAVYENEEQGFLSLGVNQSVALLGFNPKKTAEYEAAKAILLSYYNLPQ